MVGIYWVKGVKSPAVFVLSEDTYTKFTAEPQVLSFLREWTTENKDSKIAEKELTVW